MIRKAKFLEITTNTCFWIASLLAMSQLIGCKKESPVPSSAKEITAFSFSDFSPEVTGVVNGHFIHLSVPFGTPLTALVPTITFTGQSIKPALGIAQDFTTSVTYVVTAADGSTQGYEVSVSQVVDYGIIDWSASNGPTTGVATKSVAFSNGLIYAGNEMGFFVSSDNGASWSATALVRPVNAILLVNTNIYAGTDLGIYFSADSGVTWVHLGLSGLSIFSMVKASDYILAGTNNGVFRSVNNGVNWESASDGLPSQNIVSLISSGTSVFAATSSGIFLSHLGETSWNVVETGTNQNITSLAVSSKGIFAGTTKGVLFSNNNGGSWVPVNTGLSGLDISCFAVIGDNIFVATNEGVFFSIDSGSNWREVNAGLSSQAVISFAVSGNEIIVGTTAGGVFTSPLG